MTDPQRAFISALVCVFKNERFTDYHRIGVKRIDPGKNDYSFIGEWLKDSVDVKSEDPKAFINSIDEYPDPGGYNIQWTQRSTLYIDLHMEKGAGFRGYDGDNFKFKGRLVSYNMVKISDEGQDGLEFTYRLTF